MKKYILFLLAIVISPMFKAEAQTCVQPSANMISWWRAEGNALDERNLHNGTLQNGIGFGVGRVGQAFGFDGTDDATLLGNQSALQPASITIEAWIRFGQLPPTGEIKNVFAKWGFDATADSYLLGVTNDGTTNKIFGAIGDGTTGDPGLSGGDMSTNVWTHVAMTYNAADGSHRLYQNGNEVASRTRPNGIFPTASNVYFGRQDAPGRIFDGLIDELAIYSRALSQSEIQAIVNAGTAGKCSFANQLSGHFSQKQKLQPNQPVGSTGFANAVAVSGDTMIVGASGYDAAPTTGINIGAAYVFVRNSSGVWTQQAQLNAADGAAGDEFGYSVAISGETIVVGSWRSNAPTSNSGAAYVFTRTGTSWTQQQKLTAADGAADDEFGNAVAIDGNTIAVGSHSADQPSGGHAGAIYIFNRSGSVWTQAQKLIPNGAVLFGDFLGESVAMSGDTLVAGALGDQEPSRTNRGTVYVYARSGGAWSQQQKLIVPDSQPSTQLGASVAIDGDTLISGALGDTPTTSSPNQGAAYVFSRSGGAWSLQQRLTASDAAMSDFFGWSVAVRGDLAVVGARYDDTAAGADAGSAYVFRRNNSVWSEQQKLAAGDAAANDRFGVSAALNLDGTLVVGAADKNLPNGQGNGAGAAYVFNLTKRAFFDFDGDGKTDLSVFRPSNGTWYLMQTQNGFGAAQFGISTDKIVPADYDGDGKTDVAVYRDGNWYLQRSELGFTAVQFGSAGDVPRPGDFDGDGRADVAVFRPSNGVWYLNRSTLGFASVQFGQNGDAPLIADFDGDGKADVSVYRQGIWYYLQSSDGGFRAAQFGTAADIPTPGDFDGDGKTDLAVFRPANGTWYFQGSQLGFTAVQFGANGDRPVAADYDGDGKLDFAVYRQNAWYVLQSSNGQFTASQFGVSTDQPIPAAFIP